MSRPCREPTPSPPPTGELGDSIVRLGEGSGAEIVAVDYDGRYVISCGGFGAQVDDVTDPSQPVFVTTAGKRCQNIAFGPLLEDGTRVFWLTHHGDTWVEEPFLNTYHLPPGDTGKIVDVIEDPKVLFEGLVWHQGHLFVTAHGGGLRLYETDPVGKPTLSATLGGFENALEIDVDRRHAYVADGVGGVKVVSIEDPDNPTHVGSAEPGGMVRDLDYDAGRLYLALGGDGVVVYDTADPTQLVEVGRAPAMGSVQSVSVDGGLLALASWSHIAVRDARNLQLLGTEKTEPLFNFEQDLGVLIADDLIVAGEWEATHLFRVVPDLIAPDIWLERDMIDFEPGVPDDEVVLVRNRGWRDLEVTNVWVDDAEAFAAQPTAFTIEPGGVAAVEVSFEPPHVSPNPVFAIESNDPDFGQAIETLPIFIRDSDALDVGEKLTEDFAFLSPTGDLDGLRGQVTVLAYFALF